MCWLLNPFTWPACWVAVGSLNKWSKVLLLSQHKLMLLIAFPYTPAFAFNCFYVSSLGLVVGIYGAGVAHVAWGALIGCKCTGTCVAMLSLMH